MLTRADELKADIARKRAEIASNNKLIEECERRQSLRRQYGERLYNRLVKLEMELAREEALLVRPQPEDVKAGPISI